MTTAVKCPICDAEPGEKCYDPHGNLAYRDTHAGRQEAAVQATAERQTLEQRIESYQAELNRIERDIGYLAFRRKRITELLAEAEAKLD